MTTPGTPINVVTPTLKKDTGKNIPVASPEMFTSKSERFPLNIVVMKKRSLCFDFLYDRIISVRNSRAIITIMIFTSRLM